MPKCRTLPAFHEVLDRPGDLFDRHVGIDPVLVEQVDMIRPQALQRGLRDRRRLLAAELSRSEPSVRVGGSEMKPNLVAIVTSCRRTARALPTGPRWCSGP